MLKVNDYFAGQVKSIAFQTETLSATVGVMVPGEYEFATSQQETMTVVSGAMTVKLPGQDDWQIFMPYESFIVNANCRFNLKITVATAYLCTYA